MHTYQIRTLVDITENGVAQRQLPYKTKSGILVHDKEVLQKVKLQQQNFNTLLQTISMRGAPIWGHTPLREHLPITPQSGFGTFYEGKQMVWQFLFQTDQADLFGSNNRCDYLEQDFDGVPIINFLDETITFRQSTFVVNSNEYRNILFDYMGDRDIED